MTTENKKKKRAWYKKPLFLVTVAFPTLCSAVYFGLFASDVYISESNFVVRSPSNQTSLTGVGALLQGFGFSRSQDDTYTVQEYMRSRSALEQLKNEIPVRAFYEEEGDLISRFNALGLNNTEEAFYQYFKKRLTIDLDALSGIATLRIRAFNPDNAWQINQKLLALGEDLINQLNERARRDTIQFAEQAVANAEETVKQTAQALSEYRIQNNIFDISAQSEVQLTLISTLKSELIRVETQLAQLQSITPDNPQVDALKMRQKSLKAEIQQQTKGLTGGSNSLTTQSSDYQRLILNNQLAQQQLTTAMTSMQNTKAEADRQQLYLEVIGQPSKPDLALEPYRIYNTIATFIIGLILYGVFGLLIASIKEHKN